MDIKEFFGGLLIGTLGTIAFAAVAGGLCALAWLVFSLLVGW